MWVLTTKPQLSFLFITDYTLMNIEMWPLFLTLELTLVYLLATTTVAHEIK
jgi:hypothetical protein